MGYIHEHISSRDQKETPEPILYDSRGIPIEEELKVAYNYSGSVVMGTIKELKRNEWLKSEWGWTLKFELIIENEEGFVSRIKNPNSFIII